MIKDLIDYEVLYLDEQSQKLLKQKKNSEKKSKNSLDIFDLLPGNENKKKGKIESWQAEAFVRWIVEKLDEPQDAVWTDRSLFESWASYYSNTKGRNRFCCVTGICGAPSGQHPAKIRNDGDRAKLISSGVTRDKKGVEKVNDPSGFTFLGRFLTADQACSVGFEVTQKAHNALRWLVSRQGYKRGSQAVVAWSTRGESIPNPLADGFDIFGLDEMQSDQPSQVSTAQDFSLRLKKKISGYGAKLGEDADIIIMGLDSATPGRMAITFYREFNGTDFLKRIEDWHESCAWVHNYHMLEITDKNSGKKKKIHPKFVSAPAPNDIAEAAYGSKVDDKLKKSTVERILPCIVDARKIPRDLVESTVRRASNRAGKEDWEWRKTLSIACALYKKQKKDYEGEELDMALDTNRKTRDYLYGRLLALADSLEQWALDKAGETRQTNAARLMQRFADHPCSTWRIIALKLKPYEARLGKYCRSRQNMITEVTAMFNPDEFKIDTKLGGEFLLGYHCQKENLWHKDAEIKVDEKQEDYVE